CLEVATKFSHLTTQANIEQRILVGELFMPRTGVVNAAEPNAGRDWKTGAVGKEIWNRRISHSERIKWVRDRHADASGTKAYVGAWDLEWVGAKRNSCSRRIEK